MHERKSGEVRRHPTKENDADHASPIVGKTLFNADLAREAREVGETLEILPEACGGFRKNQF